MSHESTNRPLTAEEILQVIRHQIGQLDKDTYTYVADLGELDSVLFQLHWLYAVATGRMDDFVKACANEPVEEFLRFKKLVGTHERVGQSQNTDALLNRWKTIGSAIGLR